MKKIIQLLVFVSFLNVFSQNKFNNPYVEKTYVQLNNVLYEAGETVFYKIFVTNGKNKPIAKSDIVYTEIYDGSSKKINTQKFTIKNGAAEGSFTITEDLSGILKIVAYTSLQKQTDQNIFEKTFFVQKVYTPNLIMALDFTKKAYGKSHICEANLSLKNNQNEPVKNLSYQYDLFINGKLLETKTAFTNEKGEDLIKFQLPDDLNSNDGIINVKFIYDNQNESITRSIPIKLNFVDLQFLPEGGYFVENHNSKIYFIAKDENGLPLDCKGKIYNENNQFIVDFESFHNGMGTFEINSKNSNYYAIIETPFVSGKINLPKASKNVFTLESLQEKEEILVKINAPTSEKIKIILRNQDKDYFTEEKKLKIGINNLNINTNNLPTGTYALSLVQNEKIIAEKLIFINYKNQLKINVKTDKNVYQPREKVDVEIETLDFKNNPIPSHLSISVINEKTLAYINDKQHNILTWMLLGHDIKGKIHEPNFYFNTKEEENKRIKAIDLVLNTHGWRKFHQEEMNNTNFAKEYFPETLNSINGFVLDSKDRKVKTKVYLIVDNNKVYETKTNENGYFSFNKISISHEAYLLASSKKRNNPYKIVRTQKETLKGFEIGNYDTSSFKKTNNIKHKTNKINKKPTQVVEKRESLQESSIQLSGDEQNLSEVVVVSYGYKRSRNATAASTTITSEEITYNLQGRAAGVQINEATGTNNSVQIRGISSIYGNSTNNQPLYIVDGVPVTPEIVSTLDHNSFQSVEVIKDNSINATSLYGSKGLNGIVVIRTKRASDGIIISKKTHYAVEYVGKNNEKTNESAEFYIPKYENKDKPEVKNDFRTCIYWNKTIQTDKTGKAKFSFYNSDEVTSFAIIGEGISANGLVGNIKHNYAVLDPLEIDFKLPVYLSVNDRVKLPIRIKNNSNETKKILIELLENENIKIETKNKSISLNANESKIILIEFICLKANKDIPFILEVSENDSKFKIEKKLDSYNVGFPKSLSFSGFKSEDHEFKIENLIPGTLENEFSLFNNRFELLTTTMEKMLREPSGCFEQVSSSNYPNIMIVRFLENNPNFKNKKETALQYLNNGYKKLANYKSKDGGYEWYGGNPGNEALTAYGLLQFHEMKKYVDIDKKEFEKMKNWLLSRKDNQGGFNQVSGRYGFSGIDRNVNNTYITYVLSEIEEKNIEKEFQSVYKNALETNDNYKLALTALTAYNLNKMNDYNVILSKIKSNLVKKDNINVNQTVVNSYGVAKDLEFYAIYGLALLKNKTINEETVKVLNYIESKQNIYGFGSTQSNALCLKFLTIYLELVNSKNEKNDFKIIVNDTIKDLKYNDLGNIISSNELNITDALNKVKIIKSNNSPYNLNVKYQSYLPDNSTNAMVELNTRLVSNKVKLNEISRVEIELKNIEKSVLYNPLVRIGIPGGLLPEPWQLKELIEKEIIDYYEIINNELVLYFRAIDKLETRKINIDFKATVSGKYIGKASSAYLYYNNEHKNYNKGLEIEIE